MRIVSGKYKGRRFTPPDGIPTRPTTDISKEALFNILTNNIDYAECVFLDLFAGSGNISYEMASRGCTSILSVDRFPLCVQFIESIIEQWGIEGMRVIQADVFDVIDQSVDDYHLIFAGPPYGLDILDEIPDRIFSNHLLKPEGILALEHNPDHNFEDHEMFAECRTYGQTNFSFFLND